MSKIIKFKCTSLASSSSLSSLYHHLSWDINVIQTHVCTEKVPKRSIGRKAVD